MIKASLIFLLLLCLNFATTTSNASFKNVDSPESLTNELISYTHYFSITPSNSSLTQSGKIEAGSIYGGQTKYLVVASLFETINTSVQLFFYRNSEAIYISLNKSQPYWDGSLFFGGSANQLSILYVQLQAAHIIPKNGSEIHLTVFYSIYKYQTSSPSTNNLFGASGGLVGNVYPARNFVIGLMILLIGMIPETIFILLLRKYLRRRWKKAGNT